jgi:hypothetical protein
LGTSVADKASAVARRDTASRYRSPAAAQAASHQAKTPGAPSYTYTLLNYPGTLSTVAEGINLGATTSKTEIVGGYGPIPQPEAGFLAQVSGTKTVKETYKAVNYPHVPSQQVANAINDAGESSEITSTVQASSMVMSGAAKGSPR